MNSQLIDLDDALPVKPCSHEYQANCNNCRLTSICLPFSLESREVDELDRIIQRSKPLQKGQHLYREGDGFQSVFAVRSGTLKAIGPRTMAASRSRVSSSPAKSWGWTA
jgi:CRP/FNR family transcriptional regulator